jgi:hypothetical protein
MTRDYLAWPLHSLAERVHCRLAPCNADQVREKTGEETAAGLRMEIPILVARRIVSDSDDERAKTEQGVLVNR